MVGVGTTANTEQRLDFANIVTVRPVEMDGAIELEIDTSKSDKKFVQQLRSSEILSPYGVVSTSCCTITLVAQVPTVADVPALQLRHEPLSRKFIPNGQPKWTLKIEPERDQRILDWAKASLPGFDKK